jgi:hypothetical protein
MLFPFGLVVRQTRDAGMDRIMIGLATVMVPLTPIVATAAPAPRGGTIAVMPPAAIDPGDRVTATVIREVATALGTKGFTLLGDPAHAAYIADVSVERTDIGTSTMTRGAGRALPTGAGVSIPLSSRGSVLVPLQRITVQVRIRRRGDQAVLWHGGAVSVRSGGMDGRGTGELSSSLSQAAMSSYPAQAMEMISIP